MRTTRPRSQRCTGERARYWLVGRWSSPTSARTRVTSVVGGLASFERQTGNGDGRTGAAEYPANGGFGLLSRRYVPEGYERSRRDPDVGEMGTELLPELVAVEPPAMAPPVERTTARGADCRLLLENLAGGDGTDEPAADSEHPMHFAECLGPLVRRQVLEDLRGNHDVELAVVEGCFLQEAHATANPFGHQAVHGVGDRVESRHMQATCGQAFLEISIARSNGQNVAGTAACSLADTSSHGVQPGPCAEERVTTSRLEVRPDSHLVASMPGRHRCSAPVDEWHEPVAGV